MYDPWPMSDQRSDKNAIPANTCFFSRLNLEPEILNRKNFGAELSRITNTLTYQTTTSSSLTIAFDQLNDESSDTVFHA